MTRIDSVDGVPRDDSDAHRVAPAGKADALPATGSAFGSPTPDDGPHATYGWPTLDGDAVARLDVTARTRADGTLRTWDYRAEVSSDATPGDAAPPMMASQDTALPPPQLYRHDVSAMQVSDVGHRIPPQAHTFARESFIDEAATDAGYDPVSYRLHHLDPRQDAGAREVIRMVAQRAAWGLPERADAPAVPEGWRRGRGFAFDGGASDATDGAPDAWSAWIVDLDVNPQSGDIAIRRVVAGAATGKPDAAPHVSGLPAWQITDAMQRALGMAWHAEAAHDETGTDNPNDNQAAVALALQRALTQASEMPDGAHVPHELSEADARRLANASASAAAAIANALFDATGVRLRRPPFDPASLRQAFRDPVAAEIAGVANAPADRRRPARWRRWLAGGGIGGLIGGLVGLACAMLPGPAEIAPISAADNTLWSAATLERGRQVALAGDCAVCHTTRGGATNAGGLALETPFGTVYSTNLTPDPETGIGRWSYAAFARAMREGISRDGSHLYPAFPYTSFAKMSEPDMLALYGYLMSQPAVSNTPPKTELPFPLNQRRLVAGWNWMYHDTAEYRPDPSQSTLWNRGRYLVDGAGHCGACHTPRNMLGAERDKLYLRGGEAEGWRAPPLVGTPDTPVPWTEAALFDYLRTGFSPEHGVAAGPMAPVVSGLAALPESDVRAIAHYIASLSPQPDTAKVADLVRNRAAGVDIATTLGLENGRRAFEAACAVCHTDSGGVGHFGVRPLMGLNTSVSQASPDNLMHVLMNGIDQPATEGLGYMPGFRDAFDDRQMAELAAYIRTRYAPDQPAWENLSGAAARARAAHHP
ncbi:cytochrome C [Pandoraea capi]|uniref:Cytochrome C n=1 Tax=Pandoraea capi TaxID=2508286 RepID=A0ABY6W4K1_9BURK|nr:c-type cytochrome [Pandoraea capi]VVE24913.1 cytochrome C [Pandoraea capi]